MISACLWDVTALAKHLGLLVQLLKNGSHRKYIVEPTFFACWLIVFSFSPKKINVQKVCSYFWNYVIFLGNPMAPEMTFGPSTISIFAGIEL